MTKLAHGDRVEHSSSRIKGTIDHADADFVRVNWDDGQIGLMYWDGKTFARASDLIKLHRSLVDG